MNTSKETPLTQKMKDYLVGIFHIEEKKPVARVGEIAAILGVKGPSAHVMVKMLAGRQLVKHEKYGYINLTDKGREIAVQLKNKDNTIKNFFIKYLGIDEKTATEDAHKVKNVLSNETFSRIKNFIFFLENRPDHKEINIPEEVNKFIKEQ